MKYSQGPWRIIPDGDDYVRIVDVPGAEVISLHRSRGAAWIYIGDEDAKLIAASPDLLEACQAALVAMTEDTAQSCDQYVDAIDKLEAAIAKATGE